MSQETKIPDKSSSQKPMPTSRRRWPLIIVGGLVALFLLSSVSFVGATVLEEHDSFCIACHTTPESTYYDRATTATGNASSANPDLATYHYLQAQEHNQSFNCISCHRGDSSVGERLQTLTLGARDAMIFFAGKSDATIEKSQIYRADLVNAACVNCHTETLLTVKGTATHMHNFLPQTAALIASGSQLVTPAAGGFRGRQIRTVDVSLTCTDCHLAHKTVSTTPQLMYVDKTVAQVACDECHKAAGERPQSLDRLLRGDG